jgi:hypothetical protein
MFTIPPMPARDVLNEDARRLAFKGVVPANALPEGDDLSTVDNAVEFYANAVSNRVSQSPPSEYSLLSSVGLPDQSATSLTLTEKSQSRKRKRCELESIDGSDDGHSENSEDDTDD